MEYVFALLIEHVFFVTLGARRHILEAQGLILEARGSILRISGIVVILGALPTRKNRPKWRSKGTLFHYFGDFFGMFFVRVFFSGFL